MAFERNETPGGLADDRGGRLGDPRCFTQAKFSSFTARALCWNCSHNLQLSKRACSQLFLFLRRPRRIALRADSKPGDPGADLDWCWRARFGDWSVEDLSRCALPH